MKKLYALGVLGAPLLLAATWMGTRTLEEATQQQSYQLESQHFAMNDMGSLLERIGREIQQDEQVTIGGTSYPLSGFGGIELAVDRWIRGEEAGTGVELHFGSSGRTTAPVNRGTGQPQRDYDPYERYGRAWEPSALADLLAELGETLASTGTIVLEHHRVPFRGAASIDRRKRAETRQPCPGGLSPRNCRGAERREQIHPPWPRRRPAACRPARWRERRVADT